MKKTPRILWFILAGFIAGIFVMAKYDIAWLAFSIIAAPIAAGIFINKIHN